MCACTHGSCGRSETIFSRPQEKRNCQRDEGTVHTHMLLLKGSWRESEEAVSLLIFQPSPTEISTTGGGSGGSNSFIIQYVSILRFEDTSLHFRRVF